MSSVRRDDAHTADLVWIHSNFTRFDAVKIFPATNPGRQIEFHQIDRKPHKRVHHQSVDEAGEVEKADKAAIVKGFEYAKNRYIEIDPGELKKLRLPTATTMQIKQFIKTESCRRHSLSDPIS